MRNTRGIHGRPVAVCLLAGAILAVLAVPASAGELGFAELRIDVEIRADIVSPQVIKTFTFTGMAPSGTALSDSHASLASGSAFQGFDTVTLSPLAPPGSNARLGLSVGANAVGLWTGASFIDVATFTGTFLVGELSGNTFVTHTVVPFQFGGIGTAVDSGIRLSTGNPFTVYALQGPFETGPTWVGGTVVTPVFGVGHNSLTPSGGGELVLVSPIQVFAPSVFAVNALAELELHYVPEPGTTALLVWGAGALLFRAHVLARRQRVARQA